MPKGCHQDNCPAAGHWGEGGRWLGSGRRKPKFLYHHLLYLLSPSGIRGVSMTWNLRTGSLCLPCWTDLHLHPGSLTPAQGPSGIPPVLTQVPSRAGKALQSTQERSGCWGPELCPSAASRSGPLQSAWPIHLPAAMAAMLPPGIEL